MPRGMRSRPAPRPRSAATTAMSRCAASISSSGCAKVRPGNSASASPGDRKIMNQNTLHEIAAWLIPLVIAIVFHEVAHGLVARRLGDPTAAQLGRLTLNPLKHIDPLGTVVLPLLRAVSHAGSIFGWTKPVPVNYAKLRNPRRDMVLV